MPKLLPKHCQRCLQMVPDFTGLQVLGKHSFYTFRQVRQAPALPVMEYLWPVSISPNIHRNHKVVAFLLLAGNNQVSKSFSIPFHRFELLRTSDVCSTCTIGLKVRHGDEKQVLFAYRMCTGELTGPAGKLSKSLHTSPLLHNTNPWDILNTLRPLQAKVGVVRSCWKLSTLLRICTGMRQS